MSDFSPLKELAELAMGETITAADCDGLGYPIYSADTGDAPWNWSSKIRRLNSFGTIVVGARGSIGFPRFPKCDAFGATQTTITVTPNRNRITPEYLYYVLSRLDFKSISAQQAVPMLTVSELSGVQIRNLPIHEQVHIAEILNTLDTAIHETEAIIAKLKAVKQGLLHDLLTRGIDANGELRPPQAEAPHLYKQSPLGWIPKEWEACELDQLIDPVRPVVYGILMPGYGHPDGVPVVKVKDIIDDQIKLDSLLLTSPQIDREYSRSRLRAGDLLFTIRGTVGRMALVPQQLENANITQDTARLAIKYSDARFVKACLSMHSAARFVAINTLGVAVQGINLRDVRRIPLPKPSTDEAREIADRLDAAAQRLDCEGKKLEKLRLSKAGLMDDLLTGRVRVTPLLQGAQHA